MKLFSMESLAFVWKRMSTKKKIIVLEKSEFNRVMSIFDLTFLGVGSMLGMGVYIMAGSLAKTVGPAMVISFILAGIAALLSALCYAEFAGRAPGTGSAYAYCYITVGEFVAFILGWNLALEFVIGTACLARGLSGYLDTIASGQMSEYLTHEMPMNVGFLSSYPDFLAFLIMVVFSCLVSFGVKASTTVNNILVIINMITILLVIIVGIIKADAKNWSIEGDHLGKGNGGFAPFGFSSIIEGAATCFYAYTGFDTVATTGGEAKNPHKAIPIALLLSMLIAMSVYTGIAVTFTLMWPFYDQNIAAPYPRILTALNLTGVKWAVTVGAISAILGCIVGSIYGMARIVYSISYDGLLNEKLGTINRLTKTPLSATMVSGILTGIIAIIFDSDQLISMTSIGTLMAYTMVGVCVLILRYDIPEGSEVSDCSESKWGTGFKHLFNLHYKTTPDKWTSQIARMATYCLCVFAFLLCSLLAFQTDEVFNLEPSPFAGVIVFLVLFILAGVVIARQPSSMTNLQFKVRPVPLLPAISIFINVYLMLKLDKYTWLRFAVWFVIGIFIYFFFGIWNSKERNVKSDAKIIVVAEG